MEIPIPRERLTVKASRSGGPGGQNVNKVSSRIEIRFALAEADWIPPEVRARLAELFPSHVTTGGDFRVVSSRWRDQPRNLEDCLARLAGFLREAAHRPRRRIPTRPTGGSRARRIGLKKRRSSIKRDRSGGFED